MAADCSKEGGAFIFNVSEPFFMDLKVVLNNDTCRTGGLVWGLGTKASDPHESGRLGFTVRLVEISEKDHSTGTTIAMV